jgi:hypothetical protein
MKWNSGRIGAAGLRGGAEVKTLIAAACILIGCSAAHAGESWGKISFDLKLGMTEAEAVKMIGRRPNKAEQTTCGADVGKPWSCRILMYGTILDGLQIAEEQSSDGVWLLSGWKVFDFGVDSARTNSSRPASVPPVKPEREAGERAPLTAQTTQHLPTAIPNLSGYDSETRHTMELACISKRGDGPVAYGACLNRQIASLRGSPGIPNLSGYDSETRHTMELACISERGDGPVAYGACLNRQIASLQSRR